ncbi:hypothetical protein BH09PAT3_BH09PAT3_0890 [soil metagenome]
MDSSLIILAAIILVPIVVLMALRINATLVFLSLCLGSVLTQFVADDAGWMVALFSDTVPEAGSVTGSSIKLGLLLLPVILTAIFMIKTVRGGPKMILNLIPSAGVGLLGALLAVPLLPTELSITITSSPLWLQVSKLQELIVGGTALLCLFVLWLQRPKTGGEGKHGKHHG